MDAARVDAYLARLGAARPARADAEALRDLQVRHLLAVPFENLSIHLGEPIVLEAAALVEKLVGRRRGGFCYELNGAFAELLTALGFRVTMMAARVVGESGLGPPFDHLALRVDLSDSWLVDVGFGTFTTHPLRLDERSDQLDPAGSFRIEAREDGDLDVLMKGKSQYRIDPRPRALRDFEATCWWQQTSPKSHFTRSLVCTRLTENGRTTLTERTLIETTGAGRLEQVLSIDAEVLEAYRSHFDIVLERVPTLRPQMGQ